MARKENSNTLNFILALSILLAMIWIVNPLVRDTLGIYLVLLGISYMAYASIELQNNLTGISSKNLSKSIIWSGILGVGFFLGTAFIPGLSIGLPLLPQSISDTMQKFLIIFIAPIVETLFFQGFVFGFLKKYSPRNIYFAITGQAILFASAHLLAYVGGFYNYPSFVSVLSGINANLASFISAFAFAWLAGFFVSRDGIKNLTFVMIFHAILNAIIFVGLTIF